MAWPLVVAGAAAAAGSAGGASWAQKMGHQPPKQHLSDFDKWQLLNQANYQNQLQERMNQESPYQENTEIAMNRALSGNAYERHLYRGPQGMDQGQVEDYYRSTLHDPAIRQYANETRPAWMSKVGNLHSGHRVNQERRGYEDLYSGLGQQRGNLMWQNTLRNQNLEQHEADMNQQSFMHNQGLNQNAMMGALQMMPQLDPEMRAEAMYQQQMMGAQPNVTPYGGGSEYDQFWGPSQSFSMDMFNMYGGTTPTQFFGGGGGGMMASMMGGM